MAFAFYDSGRAGFEILDQFGEGDLSGESAKNMDMIFHSADLERVAFQTPQGSGQIGMNLRSELELELEEFLSDAYAQNYFAPNRFVPKSERPKWRFKVKRF